MYKLLNSTNDQETRVKSNREFELLLRGQLYIYIYICRHAEHICHHAEKLYFLFGFSNKIGTYEIELLVEHFLIGQLVSEFWVIKRKENGFEKLDQLH